MFTLYHNTYQIYAAGAYNIMPRVAVATKPSGIMASHTRAHSKVGLVRGRPAACSSVLCAVVLEEQGEHAHIAPHTVVQFRLERLKNGPLQRYKN
jgi:hypothetical protein